MQQPFAEGVHRLDLQPAGRLDRAREQPPREGEIAPRRLRRAGRRRSLAKASSSRLVHSASVLNTRSAILAAAALVKVRQRICAGGAPSSSKPQHALGQHMRLAAAGVGRHPGRSLGFGGPGLPLAQWPRESRAARLTARLPRRRRIAAGRRPFLDAARDGRSRQSGRRIWGRGATDRASPRGRIARAASISSAKCFSTSSRMLAPSSPAASFLRRRRRRRASDRARPPASSAGNAARKPPRAQHRRFQRQLRREADLDFADARRRAALVVDQPRARRCAGLRCGRRARSA